MGDVGDAVLEPFDRDVFRVERRVLDLCEGREPVDALSLLSPEALRVAHRKLVHLFVFGLVQPCALRPFRRNVIGLVGHGAPPRATGGAEFFLARKKRRRDYALTMEKATTRPGRPPAPAPGSGRGSSSG